MRLSNYVYPQQHGLNIDRSIECCPTVIFLVMIFCWDCGENFALKYRTRNFNTICLINSETFWTTQEPSDGLLCSKELIVCAMAAWKARQDNRNTVAFFSARPSLRLWSLQDTLKTHSKNQPNLQWKKHNKNSTYSFSKENHRAVGSMFGNDHVVYWNLVFPHFRHLECHFVCAIRSRSTMMNGPPNFFVVFLTINGGFKGSRHQYKVESQQIDACFCSDCARCGLTIIADFSWSKSASVS